MRQHVEQDNIKIKINKIIEESGENILFNRAFLKPMEIALKNSETEGSREKKSLAFGLKQVIKSDISNNRFLLEDFTNIRNLGKSDQQKIQSIQANNCDNLISLLDDEFKLAICVCMYCEDKGMLKKTLNGVSQNVATLVKNGMKCDQIGVFVIMDGIEPADESISQFFLELERENGICLDEDVKPSRVTDILQKQLEEEENININHIIFDEYELKDWNARRFEYRKYEYKQIKQLLHNIHDMEKDHHLTYESLDKRIVPFFLEQARQFDREINEKIDDYLQKKDDEQIIEEYGNSISKSKPIIRNALQKAKNYCHQYLIQRDNLALLSSFRVKIDINVNQKPNEYHNNKVSHYSPTDEEEEALKAEETTMNLFMVTKYKNRGKLSSHNWFFNGFCRQLNPEFSILLDVGLAPQKDALWKMINHFWNEPKVGGVCGYMALRIQRLEEQEEQVQENIDCLSSLSLHLVDIQRAQQLQYHFAHLIDKPFESIFKFIHVLPGAFSAYRMEALFDEDEEKESELMKKYFQSINQRNDITIKESKFSAIQTSLKVFLPEFLYQCCHDRPQPNSEEQLLYDQNIYLAEDRTLCLGIHQNGYDLSYLPDAYAYVDPMKTLNGLLGQRKRWINGSYFAFEKVKGELSGKKDQQTEYCIQFQVLFLTFMNTLSFVSPALFLFTCHVAMVAFKVDVLRNTDLPLSEFFSENLSQFIVYLIDFVYIMLYLALIFFSMHLTNKNKKFLPYLYIASTMLGILSIVIFVLLGVDLVRGLADPDSASFLIINQNQVESISGGVSTINSLRYVILGTFVIYCIPLLLYTILFRQCNFLIDIFFSTFSFIYYGSTYLNILNIYALCRIDDISWGTKGLDAGQVSSELKSRKQSWKRIKIIHVAKYVLWNILVASALITLSNGFVSRFYVTYIIMIILLMTLLFKVLLGVVYLILYKCRQCCNKSHIQNAPSQPFSKSIQKYSELLKPSLSQQLNKAIQNMQEDCKEKKVSLGQVLKKDVSKIHTFGKKRALKKKIDQHQSKISFIKNKKRNEAPRKNDQQLPQQINSSSSNLREQEMSKRSLFKEQTEHNQLEDFRKKQQKKKPKFRKLQPLLKY